MQCLGYGPPLDCLSLVPTSAAKYHCSRSHIGATSDHVPSKPAFQITLAIALIAASPSGQVSQTIVNEISLETLSAYAPIIVVARRTNDLPHTFITSDLVVRPSKKEELVGYTFTVWPFEIVETLKYGGHLPLESDIGVTQAGVQRNYELYLESLRGMWTSYAEARYRPEPALTLESVGSDPVVLFLARGYVRTDNISEELANSYQLYAANSLEHLARKDEIATLSTAHYEDDTRPTRPPAVDDE